MKTFDVLKNSRGAGNGRSHGCYGVSGDSGGGNGRGDGYNGDSGDSGGGNGYYSGDGWYAPIPLCTDYTNLRARAINLVLQTEHS